MQKTDFFTLLLVNGDRELLKVYLKEYLSSLTLNQVNTLLLSPYMDLYIEAIRQREETKTISKEENVEEIPETKTEEVEDVQEHDEEEILSSVPYIYFEEVVAIDKDYFVLAFKPERWSVLQTCLSHCGVI